MSFLMLMHREVVFRIMGQKGDNQDFKFSEPGSSVGKESTCNAGDVCLIPGSGRSAREGIGYPLQYSGLPFWLSC